ncbi:MAG: hypothetical protein MK080_00860 [Opitutales bacterium]|nr:hypothetical protein [Opitutales bacterium]NRA26219.1 hypothetical protein [Opitutales bacterium]
MNHIESAPEASWTRLRKWPFVVADVVLLAAAITLPLFAEQPLSPGVVATSLSALFMGCLLLILPFAIEYVVRLRSEVTRKNLQLATLRSAIESNTSKWESFTKEAQKLFNSTHLNISGYEGVLQRYDSRFGQLEGAIQQLKDTSDAYVGRADKVEESDSLSIETLEVQLAEISTTLRSLQENNGSQDLQDQPDSKLTERMLSLEQTVAQLVTSLKPLIEPLEDPDFEWSDPSGKHDSMLGKALESNSASISPSVFGLGDPDLPDAGDSELQEFDDPDVEIPEGLESEIDDEDWLIDDGDEEIDVVDSSEPDEENTTIPFPVQQSNTSPLVAEPDLESSELPQHASITANILMGIGDQLMIRGNGPGLSDKHGTPMELVEIGAYRWQSDLVNEAITVELWLNDETPALGGAITLQPGETVDLTPYFP